MTKTSKTASYMVWIYLVIGWIGLVFHQSDLGLSAFVLAGVWQAANWLNDQRGGRR